MTKLKEIYYFSVSRADYYIVKNLLINLSEKTKIKINLVLTGSHFIKDYGNTYKDISKTKKILLHKVPIKYNNFFFSDNDLINYSSKIILNLSRFFLKKKPKVIMLLGDRFETFLVAYCATLLKIPIIHIHGGELSLGSYDDAFRHSITKMSYWHLAATNQSKKRIIQLGESKNRVFNIGSLTSDNIKKVNLLSYFDLKKKLNLNTKKKIALFTYHSTTLDSKKDLKKVKNILYFLEKKNFLTIITSPSIDTNSFFLKKTIKNFIKHKKSFKFFTNLGDQVYFSLMHYSDLLIGNSSSMILEAPLMKKFSINIGERQKGREGSLTVINSDGSSASLENSLKKINFLKKRKIIINSVNFPYYKKNPIKNATKILSNLKIPNNNIKTFYDF